MATLTVSNVLIPPEVSPQQEQTTSLCSKLSRVSSVSFALIEVKSSPTQRTHGQDVQDGPEQVWIVCRWEPWFINGENQPNSGELVGTLLVAYGENAYEGEINRNHFVNPESLGDLAIRIRLTALMSNMSREATDALIRATTAAPTEEKIVPRVIVKRRASRKPLSGRKPIQQQGSPQQPKGSPGLFWTGSQGLSQRLTVGGSTGTLNVGQPMGNTSLFDSATIRGAYHRGKTDLCDETTTGDSVFLNRSHEYQHELGVQFALDYSPTCTYVLLDHVQLRFKDGAISSCFSYAHRYQKENQHAINALRLMIRNLDQMLKQTELEMKAVVEEKEKQEDNYLTSFCALMNEKKDRISLLEAENQRLRHQLASQHSLSNNGSKGEAEKIEQTAIDQREPRQEIKQARVKRKAPTAKAKSSTARPTKRAKQEAVPKRKGGRGLRYATNKDDHLPYDDNNDNSNKISRRTKQTIDDCLIEDISIKSDVESDYSIDHNIQNSSSLNEQHGRKTVAFDLLVPESLDPY